MIIPEIIQFKNINKIYTLGDIHGLFETAVYDILQLNVKDSIFIACGDIGIGFNKFNYYTTLFNKLNKKLQENNLILILFRGNHDDPMYFQHKEFRDNQFNNKFEYIKLISDYTILSINDDINILCIGGGRSIDKSYRLIKNYGYGYWKNEDIISINEVDISLLTNINIICSHVAPDFCRPKITQQTLDLFSYYVNLGDSTLIQDLEKEGQTMTEIYNQLISTNNIQQWIYGHYHSHNESIYNNIKFVGLDMIRQAHIRRQKIELDFRALTYTDLYELGT